MFEEQNNTITETMEAAETASEPVCLNEESKDSKTKNIALKAGIVAGAAGLVTGAVVLGKKLWKKHKQKKADCKAKTENVESEVVDNSEEQK